jgi:hypothetical protein
MGEPRSLLSLARRRLDLLATARATMEGRFDRKPRPQGGVSRSHAIGAETVRLAPPPPEAPGIMVSEQSQGDETTETLLPLAAIHARVSAWPEDWRDAWEERAAIMEYDGGETREEAERRAYAEYEAAAEAAARKGNAGDRQDT